ncbi:MAG TPA: desulfoferrodoxin [Firmicutes bacterium]|jgi:superoxide reductase|nr:desulfoferrodoxin [Bacillota bacterium]
MTKLNQVYVCETCGNIVEVVHAGAGKLVCCGNPMVLQEENTKDAALEKHVPVITKTDAGYEVTVGSVIHPMVDEHYIEWIELIADGKVYRQYLQPGQEPKAVFCIDAKQVSAREYCNLHGLWVAES